MSFYYIAGPMEGYEDMNGEAFDRAQELLLAEGNQVVNPHRLFNLDKPPTREQAMKVDISDLLRCDGAYMLRGWEGSRGAALEHEVARQTGMEIRYQEEES